MRSNLASLRNEVKKRLPEGTDAFDRLRISTPFTLFDSKQLYDKQPLLWDESITNGSGNAASTHSTADASVTMHAENGDTIIRQTFQRMSYRPGKSQLGILTGVIGTGATGVIKRLGLFDANDGLFFEQTGTTLRVVTRKATVDTAVAQASWNLDVMDGTGPSRITLDVTKTQIFVIDFEWLGTGRVRFGFNIAGRTTYVHEFLHANVLTSVYMSTPNLPVRYEIASTSGTAELEHICSMVASESAQERTEWTFTESTGGAHVDANTADIIYAVVGIRLKAAQLGAQVRPTRVSMIAETTNENFEWLLLLDPTVADTFTYADRTNSAIQSAKGALANTVTGGTLLMAGFASRADLEIETSFEQAFALGAAIDGTPNEVVLCVRPLTTNQDVQGAVTWREII